MIDEARNSRFPGNKQALARLDDKNGQIVIFFFLTTFASRNRNALRVSYRSRRAACDDYYDVTSIKTIARPSFGTDSGDLSRRKTLTRDERFASRRHASTESLSRDDVTARRRLDYKQCYNNIKRGDQQSPVENNYSERVGYENRFRSRPILRRQLGPIDLVIRTGIPRVFENGRIRFYSRYLLSRKQMVFFFRARNENHNNTSYTLFVGLLLAGRTGQTRRSNFRFELHSPHETGGKLSTNEQQTISAQTRNASVNVAKSPSIRSHRNKRFDDIFFSYESHRRTECFYIMQLIECHPIIYNRFDIKRHEI